MAEVTKGQVYTVGKHVIGCGDSLSSDFVKEVVGNIKIKA